MGYWKITAVLVVGLSVAACASLPKGTRDQEATAHYRLGVSALSEKKVQQAYVEFHKALELNPNDKEILNALGIVHLMYLEEYPKAKEYFERAIRVAPDYSEAYNNLGYSYEKTGDYKTAITYYLKAISNPLYPTADKAYFNIGNAYYRLGKYEDALASFREVLKRDQNLGLAYMRMALCYNALARYGDASTAMSQALKLDPIYKGSREKATEDLNLRKIRASGLEEKDIRDYLEILKY
ncbi:MAG: tetratricopeptide repeat protein [Nitrospiraceae bacterium]|nr:tetratricopeptide repeat protein [Nitrospiraceae bacterium]